MDKETERKAERTAETSEKKHKNNTDKQSAIHFLVIDYLLSSAIIACPKAPISTNTATMIPRATNESRIIFCMAATYGFMERFNSSLYAKLSKLK